MALAAQNTSRINLGTLVAIPTNRIAPVTASVIADINNLAPGRVLMAMGTGYTGQNTMGLTQITVKSLREYTQQVKGLLAGEDVLFREGEKERWVRLVHADQKQFINIKDPIQVFVAANGPRALEIIRKLADGWVTTLRAKTDLGGNYATIKDSAARAGRSTAKPYTVALNYGCVLRAGESLSSKRVMVRVGPSIITGVHAQWEASNDPRANLGMAPGSEVADAYEAYLQEYAEANGTPGDRLYQDAHRRHMVFLKPAESSSRLPS